MGSDEKIGGKKKRYGKYFVTFPDNCQENPVTPFK
jgi:hypothetical protein